MEQEGRTQVNTATAVKCRWPNGCGNSTLNPSALCHNHRRFSAQSQVRDISGFTRSPYVDMKLAMGDDRTHELTQVASKFMSISPVMHVLRSQPRYMGVRPFFGETLLVDGVTLPTDHQDDSIVVKSVRGDDGEPGVIIQRLDRDFTDRDVAVMGKQLKEDHFTFTFQRMGLNSDLLEDYDDLSEAMAAVDPARSHGMQTTYYSDGEGGDQFKVRYPEGGVEVTGVLTGQQMRFTDSGAVLFERNVKEMWTPGSVDPDDAQLAAIRDIRAMYIRAARYGYKRPDGGWVMPYGWERMPV